MLNKILSFFKPKSSRKHIKILVIDDAEVDQRVASTAVERGGYTVLKAGDGKSGLKLAREQNPSLIILDYNLPDIIGPEVCKILKANDATKEIPVLYLTSMDAPGMVINCFEQGENYLAKPISVKLLLKQIEIILKNIQK